MEKSPPKIPKITKEELAPDAFHEGASVFWSFVEKHLKTITSICVLLVLASVVMIAKNHFDKKAEKQAVNDLYPLEAQVLKTKDAFERAKTGKVDETNKKEVLTPASGDLQKDYGDSLTKLEAFATSHKKYVAGAEAALIVAGIYSDYAKADKAVEILTPVAEQFQSGGPRLISGLLEMSLGTALATKGDCQAAVAAWQKIIQDEKQKFLAPDAYLKSGTCYDSLGDSAKAKEQYEKASSSGEGSVAKTAKTLLRAMEVKKSQAAG
jgi:predicted negative regulator of RcsB-dependent stress response